MKCPRCDAEMDRPVVLRAYLWADVDETPVGPWACDDCHWVDGVNESEQLSDARVEGKVGMAVKGEPA